MKLTDYFNLIEDDIKNLKIIKENPYDCILKDTSGKSYKGFILAKSKSWKAYTLCDTSFHISDDWKYAPRLVFRRTNWELVDKKVWVSSIYQRISFEKSDDWYNELWKMIWFLNWFKGLIDTWEFEKKFWVISTDDFIVSFQDKHVADKLMDISKIVEASWLQEKDIKQLSDSIIFESRKNALNIFKNMLDNVENHLGISYIEEYKKDNWLKQKWEEIAWHHFLSNNQWIIWLNLNLKFISNFIDEGDVWVKDICWKWSPKVDIIGYSDYTVLVELKTANKCIFTDTKKPKTGRTNTWSFSDDFIDGISQCLAQKSEHDKERKEIKREWDDWRKEVLREIRTIDTECIFIIWNKEKELPLKSTYDENDIKRDTFKRYRENSKNITIITFDELYERAKNILEL